MKYLITLCLVLFYLPVIGQENNINEGEWFNSVVREHQIPVRTKDVYKGSPYFTDWIKGYMILNNGAKTEVFAMRYNMENNSIEILKNNKRYAISGNRINRFVLIASDGKIVFKNGFETQVGEIATKTLLRVIYDGKVKLLAHHTSELQENVPALGVAGDVNIFDNDTYFYLVTPDDKFHEVDLEKDDILNVLDGNNKKLQQFSDKYHLQYDKRTELKKILSYYDLLLEAKTKK